jgi:hypothetical protein
VYGEFHFFSFLTALKCYKYFNHFYKCYRSAIIRPELKFDFIFYSILMLVFILLILSTHPNLFLKVVVHCSLTVIYFIDNYFINIHKILTGTRHGCDSSVLDSADVGFIP